MSQVLSEDTTPGDQVEPDLVFRVSELSCRAVNSVGCGHLLVPLLTHVNQIEGVGRSMSNWTGNLLRVSVMNCADRERVADAVLNILTADQQSPARVVGDELSRILADEEWRALARIVELSEFEFRTLARRQLKAFAATEGLDSAGTEELLRIGDGQWARIAKVAVAEETEPSPSTYATNWQTRRTPFAAATAAEARTLLSPEQASRLQELLASRCEADAPARSSKDELSPR